MPTVLVTSASRGIGGEFVRQYAALGWRVLAACRRPAEAPRPAGDVETLEMDVTDPASVEAASAASGEPLDLLINSAGINGQADDAPGNVDYDAWREVLEVNLLGPVRVLDAFVPRLAAANGAKAVTITSGMGSLADVGSGSYMAYRTSKAAVNMAMRARSFQLRPMGIAVAVINPGWVRTDMGGSNAPLTPEMSVVAMRAVIEALTMDGTGGFFNHTGKVYPW